MAATPTDAGKAAKEILHHLVPRLAAACVGGLTASVGLILTNGSLRDLILHTESGWLAGILLAVGFVSTFGAAAIGLGVNHH